MNEVLTVPLNYTQFVVWCSKAEIKNFQVIFQILGLEVSISWYFCQFHKQYVYFPSRSSNNN